MNSFSKHQVINCEFYHLVSRIFKAINQGKNTIIFKQKGFNQPILKLLQLEGYILSFKDYKSVVYIRLKNNIAQLKQHFINSINFIKIQPRVSRRNYTISLQKLIKCQRREGNNVIYILNTDKGLMTSLNAIRQGLGGKLLLKIV
jgi:ribosomal protein S8